MTDRPISFTLPLIRRLRAGAVSQLRRPAGIFDRCQPGERLWIREPFRFDAAFDRLAPTQILRQFPSADIHFDADGDPSTRFGVRRFARVLPRAAHRSHLVIRSMRQARLRDLTEADCQAEGYPDCVAFAAAWDAHNAPTKHSITGDRVSWADNPRVVVIAFDRVEVPIDYQTRSMS